MVEDAGPPEGVGWCILFWLIEHEGFALFVSGYFNYHVVYSDRQSAFCLSDLPRAVGLESF